MTELSASTQWQEQIARWRDELEVSPTFNLLDQHQLVVEGVSLNGRTRSILNLVAAEKYLKLASCDGGGAATQKTRQPKARARSRPTTQLHKLQQALRHTVVDLSQNPARRKFSGSDHVAPTMCTSANLVHLGLMRAILPQEMLYMQGHNPCTTVFPQSMSGDQIRKLAGEGMALPCLALCIWSQFLVKGFPAAEA